MVSGKCGQCEEKEGTGLHFICIGPAFSDLRPRYLNDVSLHGKSADSLPFEGVIRLVKNSWTAVSRGSTLKTDGRATFA